MLLDADEVVLVDLTPEALQARLRAGKVCSRSAVVSLVEERAVTRVAMPTPSRRGLAVRLRGDLLSQLERLEGVDVLLIANRRVARRGGDVSAARRVLVATDHERCPTTALEHATDLAGSRGEVVLASVLVVPHSQPLTAALDRAVSTACGMLDDAERATSLPDGSFDTRLVRARSFAEGVLETLAAEPFDLLLVEKGRDDLRNGAAGQIQTLLQKASATVLLVRSAPTG